MDNIINELRKKCERFETDLKSISDTVTRMKTDYEGMQNLLKELDSYKSNEHNACSQTTPAIAVKYVEREWLREVKPLKFPYFPQPGDRIVFLKQGYQEYLQEIEKRCLYSIDELDQSWKCMELKAHEIVDLVSISFEKLSSSRVCNLKLRRINFESLPTDDVFNVKYHHVSGISDFLVLKDDMEASLQRTWKIGTEFCWMIYDEWIFGKILKIEPYDNQFPDSQFKRFCVELNDGSHHKMSPWELYPIHDQSSLFDINGSVYVDSKEMKKFSYHPEPTEWQGQNRDEITGKICDSLRKIMELQIFRPFIDISDDQIYVTEVAYPIDLRTIISRLENSFYRRFDALQFDVDHITRNIGDIEKQLKNKGILWEKSTTVFQSYKTISGILANILENPLDKEYISSIYHSLANWVPEFEIINNEVHHRSASFLQENDEIESPLPENAEVIEHHNEFTKDDLSLPVKAKEIVVKPNNVELETQATTSVNIEKQNLNNFKWQVECKKLLEIMQTAEESIPIREPMSPGESLDYRGTVGRPTNLQEVKEDLEDGIYHSPLNFQEAVDYLFNKSRQYIWFENEKIALQITELKSLYWSNMEKILDLWKESKMIKSSLKRKHGETNNNHVVNSQDAPSKIQKSSMNSHGNGSLSVNLHKTKKDRNTRKKISKIINSVDKIIEHKHETQKDNTENVENQSKDNEDTEMNLTLTPEMDKIKHNQLVNMTGKVVKYKKKDNGNNTGEMVSFKLSTNDGKIVRCIIANDFNGKNISRIKKNRIVTLENARAKLVSSENPKCSKFQLSISRMTNVNVSNIS